MIRVAMAAAIAWGLCSAVPAQEPPEKQVAGPFESRTEYTFPFETRAAWLTFVRTTPGGVAAADDYSRLFPEADYARYRRGVTTRQFRISYRSDGLLIRGLMVQPRTPGPHPVIIFNHGGVMQWGRIILPEVLEFHRLAERGYIVVASNYRGEGGSEGKPSMDGGDVNDVLALLKLIDTLPNADRTRIGMWGFSRGGLVTYGALTRTDRIAAAVIVGGPTDLADASRRAEFDEHVYPHVIADYARDKDAALARLSPIRWPERLAAKTPILLLQGGDDPRVPPGDALRMALSLQQLKRSFRLKLYEGGSHSLVENMADVRLEMDRWLDAYVRDRKSAPPNGVTVLPQE